MTDPTDEQDYLWARRDEVLYRAQLSSLYHRKRERFFDFADRLTKAVAIIGGSAAFARLGNAEVAVWAGGLVALTSTAGLVFGLAERARRHADLARQFLMLEAEMAALGERAHTEADLNRWGAKALEIEAAEPPTLGTLITHCQNELAIASNQAAYSRPIAWWRRSIMHIR